MKSQVFWSQVSHSRNTEAQHSFRHAIFTFSLELDELESLNRLWPLIGFDRFAICSLRSRDYLQSIDGDLREKLLKYCELKNLARPVRAQIITMPRFFGYVFNPVTFFILRDHSGSVSALLAEVHNTFGESFVYALTERGEDGAYEFEKLFFVSPFFDVSGKYRLTLHQLSDRLHLSVELRRAEGTVFTASISGKGIPLNLRGIALTLVRFPVSALLTMLRIEIQALKLFFLKGVRPKVKPNPPRAALFSSRPSWFDRARLAAIDYGRRIKEQS